MLVLFYIYLNCGSQKKNSNSIYDKFKTDFSNIIISKVIILDILHNARLYIAYYIKHVYILKDISNHNGFHYFSCDESDFIKLNGNTVGYKHT